MQNSFSLSFVRFIKKKTFYENEQMACELSLTQAACQKDCNMTAPLLIYRMPLVYSDWYKQQMEL